MQPESVNAEAVARKLNATILFYALCPDQSYLWAIDGQSYFACFDSRGKSEIDSHVRRYQKAILRSSDPIRQTNEDAQYLFDTLVAPAAANLEQGRQVVLISDGSLDELNFETLLAPGDSRPPLLDRRCHDCEYQCHSIDRPARITRMTVQRWRWDAIDWRSNLSGQRLSQTTECRVGDSQREKAFFGGSRSRTDASEAPFRPHIPTDNRIDFAYIHFVAHGTASRLSPLDSAVVLSVAGWASGYFQIYAREIVQRPVARTPGHHLDLLWIGLARLRGRRTCWFVVGVSARRRA